VCPQVLWAYKLYAGADFCGVAFTYTSHDGDSGYPGTLTVTADYRLTASNALHMTFSATTDKATVQPHMCVGTCSPLRDVVVGTLIVGYTPHTYE
jgi:hypothetical protein